MLKTLTFAALLTILPLGADSEAAEPIGGAPDAAVQVVIYGNLQCAFTRRLMTYVSRFEADYGTKIGIQFSQFPLTWLPESKPAGVAALCANRQGELRPFLDEAFAHPDRLGRDFYLQIAKDIGVRDQRTFGECLDDKAMAAAVDAEYDAGVKAGVNSTPTAFIGKEVVRGVYPYAEFAKRINKELGQKE